MKTCRQLEQRRAQERKRLTFRVASGWPVLAKTPLSLLEAEIDAEDELGVEGVGRD